MQVTLEKIQQLVADMAKISATTQKVQEEHWEDSMIEFDQLLAGFDPKGILSFPKMYRLMHLISGNMAAEKSPLEMELDEPKYDGKYLKHVQRISNMLLVPQSPYAQRYARVWMAPLEGNYYETPPTHQGHLANASLSHLGAFEAIPAQNDFYPKEEIEFIPFDEVYRIVFLNDGPVRLALISFEYERGESFYWLPSTYAYSQKDNEKIGNMTLFGQRIMVNDNIGERGLAYGVQDLWLTDADGENKLFGLPNVAIIEFPLDRKDPNVIRKALARGINPFDGQKKEAVNN